MSNEFLWVEKYRPKTIQETILPDDLKETFQKIVDSGEIPNMLFTGTAGLGKTTVARAICNELGLDYYLMKPWDPPEQNLYPILDDLLLEWSSTVTLTSQVAVLPQSSWTVRVTLRSWRCNSTLTELAPACLTMLVQASWTMR